MSDYSFFIGWCKALHFPEPTPEYKFHPVRKWRLDFAFVDFKVGVEINGGVWKGGRHNRGAGYLKDLEKMNELAAMGWKVIQVTPDQLYTNYTESLLKRMLI